MDIENKTLPENLSIKPEIDISEKLTLDDIDKIEKYRQTRKTSVLTIMFTDIVGFTKFTNEAGEKISASFRHIHDEIIINQIKKDGHGEVIKEIGDSFLIVFSDPTIAVKQALKIQQLLRVNKEAISYKDYILKVRIGLHMGQVSVEDHIVKDVFGTHVNLASRIMSLAMGGQVLVSGTVWENASGWLKEDKGDVFLAKNYGKIRLKGFRKPTEIYEFYLNETGKIGKPKPLAAKHFRSIVLYIATITLAVFTLLVIAYLIISPVSRKTALGNKAEKKKIILAKIDSFDEDIEFVRPWTYEYKDRFKDSLTKLKILNSEKLEKVNERFWEILKTNFISDYDIVTENDLKIEYSKLGITVPPNFRYDTLTQRSNLRNSNSEDFYGTIITVIPHIYEIENENCYFLFFDFSYHRFIFNDKGGCSSSGINSCFTNITCELDSVSIIINNEVTKLINNHKRSSYSAGKVIGVSENDVLIIFEKNNARQIPSPGVLLEVIRPYDNGFRKASDKGVKQRLGDLEKVKELYGTIENWQKNVDATEEYYWSYNEYRDLQDSIIHMQGDGFSLGLDVSLKLIEVYDSTGLAIINYQKYHWMKPEIGDRVTLK